MFDRPTASACTERVHLVACCRPMNLNGDDDDDIDDGITSVC